MLEKFILSDKDYEYLTKGIACGVGLGTILGIIIDDIILGFSFGGVVGILIGCIYSYYKKATGNEVKDIK